VALDPVTETATAASPPTGWRRWLPLARVLYLVGAVAILGYLVVRRRDDIGHVLDGAQPGWLALALLLGFGQLVLNARYWAAALAVLGEPRPTSMVLDSSARSLLARYLPGSIWYQVGRSVLLTHWGVPARAVATVAGLDTAMGVVVGAALGAVLLAIGDGGPGTAILVPAVVVLAVGCSPPVVNHALRLLARWRGGEVARISWPHFLGLVGWMAVFWGASAAGFVTYLHAFPNLALPSVVDVAGSFMVAWVVGFFVIFAPQGAGVFEATVAGLLTNDALTPVVVIVAGYRALLLVRDLVAVGVAAVVSPPR